ncbi:ABC transporter substrate-binding protein [Salinarimonas ramus]|uniref:ABC transporter substrate-binding protein n=1 Tax=Salinarimonas ramus TaxID=690164 RepID=A0A917V7Y1_9HYPH|nr:ABC transporter substrate-binding protein [Salinarimonas ramus]GGK48714.1 ABC transporter substrate-binding protein [Salinarimonas ramus]
MKRSICKAALVAAMSIGASAASAQVLQLAVSDSPAGLDPHIVTAFTSFQVVNGTIYEALTQVEPDLTIGPALAESWEVSDDGLTYTFTLREGVTFHDGSAMTAEDVVASIERVRAEATGSPLASRLAAVESASAVDDRTVEVTLSEPSAPFLTQLASIAIVPAEYRDETQALQQQPVGTGPFAFAEWQPNNYIQLDANPDYWREDAPKLDGIRFNIVPESATRQVGLTSGQYQMLPNIDAATALQLQGRPGVALQDTLELSYTLLGMNTSKPPFDDPRVRQAVNYALDRESIVQAALFGAGVAAGPLSPALEAWARDVSEFPCYEHSPDRARALLEEAGVELPVKVTMLVLPRQDIRDIAQVAQAQLNAAGFEVELNIPELGQFVQDWRNSNFDIFASANAGSVDPDDFFYRAFRTGGSTNVFKYSDERVDALLDTGRTELDQEARKAAYDELQGILACEGPVAHVAYGQLYTAVGEGVDGFEIIANRSLSTLADTTAGQ